MSQAAADAAAALPAAEEYLLEWATGRRSTLSEMMNAENYLGPNEPDRQTTLVRAAQADVASLELARQRVLALQTLKGIR